MSSAELLVIAFVAVVVFGPSKLPMLSRHLGVALKTINKFKQQLNELWQQQIKEADLLNNNEKAKKADLMYKTDKEKQNN